MFLLRGNHECRGMAVNFTFKTEVLKKYDESIFNLAIESFQALPLVAIVDDSFFCLHGGLSPSLKKISDIECIDRFRDPIQNDLMFDLLWADPMDNFTCSVDSDMFVDNVERRASFKFRYVYSNKYKSRKRVFS
jgi:serine/threonine-protein phosphatase 2B catalytic subunit